MDNSETAAQTEVIEIIQEADTKSEDSWNLSKVKLYKP